MKNIFIVLKYKVLYCFAIVTLISTLIYFFLYFIKDSMYLSLLEINIIVAIIEIMNMIIFLYSYYCDYIERNDYILTQNLIKIRLFNTCNKEIDIVFVRKNHCRLSNICGIGEFITGLLIIEYLYISSDTFYKSNLFLLIICLSASFIFTFHNIIQSKSNLLEYLKDKIDLSGYERFDVYLDKNKKFRIFIIIDIFIAIIAFIIYLYFD